MKARLLPDPGRRVWLGTAAGWLAGAGMPGAWAATPGVDAPPEPQPPRPVRLPPMVQQRLGNGLTVITVPRPGLPLVSARLLLRVGAASDPPDRSGLAAMTATLLTKGARRAGRAVGAAALAREAEALGGALASDSGWRSLSLGMTVTTPRLPAVLSLLADVLRQPLLAADELERARAQALDGLRIALASPGELAGMVMRRAFWGDSAYGAVAPPAALKRLEITDVQQFHARHARPELAALVLAGDIGPERAAWLAQQWLGDWVPSGALAPALPETPPRPVAPPLVLVDLPGAAQTAVRLAVPCAASDAPDRLVGVVANALLGGGYSSRLNQAVRIRRGLSYGADSYIDANPSGGMLVASSQTQHGQAAEVLALMRAELARLADSLPDADELLARQATLVGSFARQLQTTGGLAQLVVGQWVQGRPLQALQHQTAELLAVTPQQVRDYAQRHWGSAVPRAVLVGQVSAMGPLLAEAQAPEALRLPLATLDLEQPGLLPPVGVTARRD